MSSSPAAFKADGDDDYEGEEKKTAGSLSFAFVLQDFNGHVIDGLVIENHDATVRARLDMDAGILAKLVVGSAKIVADCLYGDVELVGDLVGRSIGQAVFEAAQLVECDSFSHNKGVYDG